MPKRSADRGSPSTKRQKTDDGGKEAARLCVVPNEVLVAILGWVARPPDLFAFTLCSRSFAALAIPFLWRRVFLENGETVNLLCGLDRTGRKENKDWNGGMFDYWQHVQELVFVRSPPSVRTPKPITKHSIHNIVNVMWSQEETENDADPDPAPDPAPVPADESRRLPHFRTLRFLWGQNEIVQRALRESPRVSFASALSAPESSWTSSPLLTPDLLVTILDTIVPHNITVLDLSGLSLTRPLQPKQLPALISLVPHLVELHQPHHILYSSSLETFLREVGPNLSVLTLDFRTASGAVRLPSWEAWKSMKLKVLTLATVRVLGSSERAVIGRYLSSRGAMLEKLYWAVCGRWRTSGFSNWRFDNAIINVGEIEEQRAEEPMDPQLLSLHLSYPAIWCDEDFHRLLIETKTNPRHARLTELIVRGELVEDVYGTERPYAKYALMEYIRHLSPNALDESEPPTAEISGSSSVLGVPDAPLPSVSSTNNKKGRKWGEQDYVPPWDLELELNDPSDVVTLLPAPNVEEVSRPALPQFQHRAYPYPRNPLCHVLHPLKRLELSGVRTLSEDDVVIIVSWLGAQLKVVHIAVDNSIIPPGSSSLPPPHWPTLVRHFVNNCKRLTSCALGVLMPSNMGVGDYTKVYEEAHWDIGLSSSDLSEEEEEGIESHLVKTLASGCIDLEMLRYPVVKGKDPYPHHDKDSGEGVDFWSRLERTWDSPKLSHFRK
ncbi:hypothetical protein M427DRAFT_151396 [Gonapodya prolifera JEL478]|uniref:F-box domain-containing protein n=1 Tax=Gonapodya prolifera (strain JEL478) TaxID=1344416 RepID=A0A139AXB1_GONPJ|nr:hypothetical protein M427DRAFT_151396 [Gonapodya prolifera JEL478]|eukprot:KXS21347.1 hypothetical protein M427DRAFT_151396 [Gonapodya prolifera JEL478]